MRIGINPTSIGVSAEWWLRAVRDAEAAGFGGAWTWDHFVSKGTRKTDPVLECWTMLAAAARETTRIRLGSFVIERHEPPPGGARADGGDDLGAFRRSARPGHRRRRCPARA